MELVTKQLSKRILTSNSVHMRSFVDFRAIGRDRQRRVIVREHENNVGTLGLPTAMLAESGRESSRLSMDFRRLGLSGKFSKAKERGNVGGCPAPKKVRLVARAEVPSQ